MTDPIGTAQERELLPCPFCGGDGACAEVEDDGYAQVLCVCTAMGPLRKSEAEAIEAWNAGSDQSRIAEVGRLEERVAELWEAIFRVKDRCWEADDANWQHDILSIVVPLTDAKIDEVRAALSLQRGV